MKTRNFGENWLKRNLKEMRFEIVTTSLTEVAQQLQSRLEQEVSNSKASKKKLTEKVNHLKQNLEKCTQELSQTTFSKVHYE